MLLPDVNVLVYAFRGDSEFHDECLKWLQETVNSPQPFALSELVLSGFVRVVTNPRQWHVPSSLEEAFELSDRLLRRPNCTVLRPGARHWEIFTELCRGSAARGNLVSDAYHAALALEHGATWVSVDGDFGRFPGLDWRRPF